MMRDSGRYLFVKFVIVASLLVLVQSGADFWSQNKLCMDFRQTKGKHGHWKKLNIHYEVGCLAVDSKVCGFTGKKNNIQPCVLILMHQ